MKVQLKHLAFTLCSVTIAASSAVAQFIPGSPGDVSITTAKVSITPTETIFDIKVFLRDSLSLSKEFRNQCQTLNSPDMQRREQAVTTAMSTYLRGYKAMLKDCEVRELDSTGAASTSYQCNAITKAGILSTEAKTQMITRVSLKCPVNMVQPCIPCEKGEQGCVEKRTTVLNVQTNECADGNLFNDLGFITADDGRGIMNASGQVDGGSILSAVRALASDDSRAASEREDHQTSLKVNVFDACNYLREHGYNITCQVIGNGFNTSLSRNQSGVVEGDASSYGFVQTTFESVTYCRLQF